MDVIHELGSLALGSRFKRISDRFMSEAAKIYAAQDVPFEPRWFPLFSLLAKSGALTIGQAAESLGVSHVAVSQTVKEMRAQDVITSASDLDDKRKVFLSLSPKGESILARIEPLWRDINGAVDDVLRTTGVDVVATLARLERSLDAESLFERTQRRVRARSDDGVTIVDYRPELKDSFRALNEEWITRFFKVEAADKALFTDPEARIIAPGGHILFAMVEGEALGTVALIPHAGKEFELCKMAVTPRAQGRHLGKRLMQAAIDRARASGAAKVTLETNDMLTAAVNMYRSFGFVEKELGGSHGYERVNVVMELSLGN